MAATSAGDVRQTRLDALFAAIDAKDTSAFLDFLADDASFRFGSAPAAEGREAIGEAVEGFFSTIAGLEHTLAWTFADGDTLVCEGDVTYTRHDGSKIALPFVDVFDMDGDKIKNYKIYMDIAPLYA